MLNSFCQDMVDSPIRINRKRHILGCLALIAIVGVEIIIIASFYIPTRSASRDYTLRYNEFVDGQLRGENNKKETDDNEARIRKGKSSQKPISFKKDAASVNVNNSNLLTSIHSHCSQFNFSFVSPVVKPAFGGEQKSNLFLLVLIVSGVGKKKYLEQRNAIRSTWAIENSNNTSQKWKHVFLLGKTKNVSLDADITREAATYNDILVLDFLDNYENLIIKVLSGFVWALMHVKPRFVLKADDDTFVHVPAVVSWLERFGTERLYGGLVNHRSHVRRLDSGQANSVADDCFSEDRYPSYASGPCYAISSNALHAMIGNVPKWKAFPVEDAYMGVLARESSIDPVSIPGFKFSDDGRPFYHQCTLVSSMVFGHYFDSSDLRYIQRKIRENDRLPRDFYACLWQESAVIVLLILLVSSFLVILYAVVIFRPY